MADNALYLESIWADRAGLRRWLSCANHSDDALQIVAEKLLGSGEEPSDGYFATMCRTATVDLLRSQNTREKYELAYATQSEYSDDLSPERHAQSLEALEALQAAISSLSPLTREIFTRAAINQQPRAEIAALLGLHLSTVEKRLATARRHCLKRLKPYL